jgi:hypothetical protein
MSNAKTPPVPVVQLLNRIRGGVGRLHRKMVPPQIAMFEMIVGMWVSQALGVAAKLGVADIIGEGTVSSEVIAEKTGVAPEPLYRLLRALAAQDIFEESSLGQFKLTGLGRCLRSDVPESVRAMAIFQSQYQWPHWAELLSSVKTGETAAEKVRGKSLFEFMVSHPDAQTQFDEFMASVSSMETSAVLGAYSFASYKVIADIGGGTGRFLSAILESAPRAKGILYDQPHVVKGAYDHFSSPSLKGRCEIVGGNFFESVPSGAEAYVMKHIIHDWEESLCVKILGNIRNRIPSNGKLILVETVVPGPHVPHFSKLLDLEMLVAAGGKERTVDQYRDLFSKCRFKLERVVPTVSMASVIEANPV